LAPWQRRNVRVGEARNAHVDGLMVGRSGRLELVYEVGGRRDPCGVRVSLLETAGLVNEE
jgi:hypothetical protein